MPLCGQPTQQVPRCLTHKWAATPATPAHQRSRPSKEQAGGPSGTERAQLGPPRDKPRVAGLHFGGHKQPWLRPSRWARVTLNSPVKSKMRSPASGLRPRGGLEWGAGEGGGREGGRVAPREDCPGSLSRGRNPERGSLRQRRSRRLRGQDARWASGLRQLTEVERAQ